jgi:hypothetical protein
VPNFAAVAPIVFVVLIFGALIGTPLLVGWRQVRQDRRKIMAEGVTGRAMITKILPNARTGRCVLSFSFQPSAAHRAIEGKQRTTQAVIDKLGLMLGSTVQVHYLPKWPKFGFIDAVTQAERVLPCESSNSLAIAQPRRSPSLFYVSYAATNSIRWFGTGDVVITDSKARFTAQLRRPFWFPKVVEREVALDSIVNVERFDARI